MVGSDDGAIYAWSEGTRGPFADGTFAGERRGGESLAFLSVILSFPVKPFSRRYRRLFRTGRWSLRLCVLCLVFGWFRVQAATMIEGRERTGDFGPWRVPYNISARGTFLFQKEILVCGGATISVWNWVKSWCTLGYDRDVINWLAASGGGNRVWF